MKKCIQSSAGIRGDESARTICHIRTWNEISSRILEITWVLFYWLLCLSKESEISLKKLFTYERQLCRVTKRQFYVSQRQRFHISPHLAYINSHRIKAKTFAIFSVFIARKKNLRKTFQHFSLSTNNEISTMEMLFISSLSRSNAKRQLEWSSKWSKMEGA